MYLDKGSGSIIDVLIKNKDTVHEIKYLFIVIYIKSLACMYVCVSWLISTTNGTKKQ